MHTMNRINLREEIEKRKIKKAKKELDKRRNGWYYIEALPRGGARGKYRKRKLLRNEKSS